MLWPNHLKTTAELKVKKPQVMKSCLCRQMYQTDWDSAAWKRKRTQREKAENTETCKITNEVLMQKRLQKVQGIQWDYSLKISKKPQKPGIIFVQVEGFITGYSVEAPGTNCWKCFSNSLKDRSRGTASSDHLTPGAAWGCCLGLLLHSPLMISSWPLSQPTCWAQHTFCSTYYPIVHILC